MGDFNLMVLSDCFNKIDSPEIYLTPLMDLSGECQENLEILG